MMPVVVITPAVAAILRISSKPLSAKYRSPAAEKARPIGLPSLTSVPRQPSPSELVEVLAPHAVPEAGLDAAPPATAVTTPVMGSIRRIRPFDGSEKKTAPFLSAMA